MLKVGSGGKSFIFEDLVAAFLVCFERFQGMFSTWNSTLTDLLGALPKHRRHVREGPMSDEFIRSFLGKALTGEQRAPQSSRGRNQGAQSGGGTGGHVTPL